MHQHFRLFTLSLLLILTVSDALSQQNTRSPYSLFGVGLLHYNGFADNAANGRNGFSYRGPTNYSLANPASLSSIQTSVFNVSPYTELGKFKTSTINQDFSNVGFNYIALAVPMDKIKSGLSIGLMPYSNVGYNILNVKDSGGISVRNEFEGSGGLARFNIGFGTRVWKYVSLGVNYSRLFGQLNENQRRRYPGDRFMTSYEDKSDVYLSGNHFDLGIHIHSDSSSKFSHVLGVVFSTETKLKGERNRLLHTFNELSEGFAYYRDTLINNKEIETSVIMPTSLNVSYSIGKNEQWQATAGYGKTLWSQYKSIYGDNGGLVDDQNYSLGFFICPSPHFDISIKGNRGARYLRSIRYSIGFYHNDGYINAHNSKIAENGLTFGLGLPFTRSYTNPMKVKVKYTSRIFLTGEFVRRGTMANNLIQEDFFKFTLGLNLADKWFNKKFLY